MNELDIFSGALEREDSIARARYLDEACDGRPELRERIESLLQNAAHVSQFLESPPRADGITINQSIEEEAGTQIGPYKLIKQLGRGGMGVVYEAEQESLGRRVALKILPFAALLNETQLERFATEATAAARLQHDNIVTVYSVGCERGIHFIAMQLIEGPSLSQVITELRHERHPDEKQQESADTVVAKKADVLTRDDDGGHYRAVARIVREAAEALHYAHENGVLHRDIKPSNLLLDNSGHVWIADFGLARIEDESQLTRTGDILGTLHYMSPEQATGQRDKIDGRADVYSLGATLYELATLRPVFDSADRREVIKQVVAGNPVAPHKIDPSVPRPLSFVISKAMARRLDERYKSAQELADDLQRFLDGEPVSAKPPTFLRRSRAWARRHRLVSAAIVSLLILILLLPFTHHFFQRVPDDSQTKGQDMKVSKTAKVVAAVATVAIVTAGVNAGKPPKNPGLSVRYELLGTDYDPDSETGGIGGVLVQQEGKYLVAGGIRWPQSIPIVQVTRWNDDGTVDTEFGNDQGRFVCDIGDEIGQDRAWGLTIQPDNRIVVVGTWGEWRFPFIARLTSDGILDASFNASGAVPGVVNDPILGSPHSQFSTVTVLDDGVGSIVTGGRVIDTSTDTMCPLLVKFRPDGTRDPSFGQNGISFVNLGAASIIVRGNSLAEFEDGRLLAAGTGPDFATSALFMFKPDGSLDPTFGNGGLAQVDFDQQGAECFQYFVVQPDGKIVAVGGASSNPDHASVYHNNADFDRFTIARFNPDGTLDKRGFAKPWGAMVLDLAPGGTTCTQSVSSATVGVSQHMCRTVAVNNME